MPAWIDTSSAETGSSSARTFGLQWPAPARYRCAASGRRRTPRDTGWRLPCAIRRCRAARRLRSSIRFLSKPLALNGSDRTSNTGSRGSSEATGSWNTTCSSPRSSRRVLALERRDVGAEHLDRARLRGRQLHDLVQRGRLARPGFTDDAQRAALLQLEADAVDGAHLADLPAEHHPLGQLVCLDQVPDA